MSAWTEEKVAALVRRWNEGASASAVAAELGVTKNMVIGKVDRLRRSGVVMRGAPGAAIPEKIMTTLPLISIRIDGGTQSRAELNEVVVADYVAVIRDGTDFPPVTVFFDGKHYWLADGFHRFHAYRQAGAIDIAADVREGTARDAKLFSVGANGDHGLRRTNADKRSAVMMLLDDDEWGKWSDREIARQAKVSHNFVSSIRASLSSDDSERVVTTKHGTTATMNVAKIGKKPQAERDVEKEAKAAARAERDAQQAANDAAREENRRAIAEKNPAVAAIEAAKARNGSTHAAVAGTKPEPQEHPDAIRAERDELREENAALRDDVARLQQRLTTFDDIAVQWEKGGFEAVKATLEERIRGLKRQVETESADKATWYRRAEFWKKQAIDLGYVSPNSAPDEQPAASLGADVTAPF